MGETNALPRFSRLLSSVEWGLSTLAAIAMFAVMMIVIADVTMRYVFAAPLSWSYDIISLYLMVAVFFLALGDTLQHHGHIAIDLLQPHMPVRLRHIGETIGYALTTVLVAMIAWEGWERLATAFANHEVTPTVIQWPTWPAYAFVVVGSVSLALRAAYRTVGHLASAIAGRALVELPPPPETELSVGETAA
jgi:TRAP-type C4-dicarboxylate transport system permease small subunit